MEEATTPPAWTLYSRRQSRGLLAILFLVIASNYFDYYILSMVLDPIKREFGASDTMLGLLSGFSFALFYAVAALPLARWADHGNRRAVITLALVGWSVMTITCGLARSFWQLVFARLGVALAEPGAAPPAQSLIADYFPPERRAAALSVLTQGGSAVGYCMAVGVGGFIAARYGWRSAFVCAGLPGLLLAIMVRFFVAEPRSQLGFPAAGSQGENTRESIARLRGKRAYVFTILGLTVLAFFGYGTSVFLPSFMIRDLHATLEQVSVTWGFVVAGAMLLGAFSGGYLADRLSQWDMRWYAWLPAIACALGGPLYWLALSAKQLWEFIAIDFAAEWILAIGYSVSFSAIHAVCGQSRRALAVAIVYFVYTLLGCGFGPLVAGAMSDALSSVYGQESLRYSLLSMVVFLIPAALAFAWASRTMTQEREDLHDEKLIRRAN